MRAFACARECVRAFACAHECVRARAFVRGRVRHDDSAFVIFTVSLSLCSSYLSFCHAVQHLLSSTTTDDLGDLGEWGI